MSSPHYPCFFFGWGLLGVHCLQAAVRQLKRKLGAEPSFIVASVSPGMVMLLSLFKSMDVMLSETVGKVREILLAESRGCFQIPWIRNTYFSLVGGRSFGATLQRSRVGRKNAIRNTFTRAFSVSPRFPGVPFIGGFSMNGVMADGDWKGGDMTVAVALWA